MLSPAPYATVHMCTYRCIPPIQKEKNKNKSFKKEMEGLKTSQYVEETQAIMM